MSIAVALALLLQAAPVEAIGGPWTAAASNGVSARIEPGDDHGALRLDYDFGQVAGYAYAARPLPIEWGANYRLVMRVRGDGGVNDLQIKFVDASGKNVWWVQRHDFRPPLGWTTITLRPRDLGFAWGPAADRVLRRTARVEIVVVRGRDGGAGHLEIGALTLTPLPPPVPPPPMRASDPATIDGRRDTAWRGGGGQSLLLDFGGLRELGGLMLHWRGPAPAYAVEASDDGRAWRTLRRVVDGDGGDDPLALPETETRYLRIALPPGAPAAALAEVAVMPLAWAATPNAFIASLAGAAPRGAFPRGFSGEQPYWTLVGTDGGTQSGLIGEDGAIEVARGGFSIEPFVVAGGKRYGWAQVNARQSLEDGYLPLPHVTWETPGWRLDTAVFADVTAPRLVARYRLTNTGPVAASVRLVLAVRPFQVNPPAQFLGRPGGVSPIGAIAWDGARLTVTSLPAVVGDPATVRVVTPLAPPSAVGTSAFDRGALGDPTAVSGASRVTDPTGLASAALAWDVSLAPGDSAVVPVLLPFAGAETATSTDIVAAHAATVARWRATLGRVAIRVPPQHRAVADSLRSAVAQILMSRQGPALQPGTRAYDRSWIRDGAMMSDTLLRVGLASPVRGFADWYGGKLFANGQVPCCVDRRGPDPVPENDAQGEFIHLLVQLYRYTGDRARLAADWPRIDAARRYMESQRQSQRTPANHTAAGGVRYGLMPPSISHEGYSAEPQYSLWDDFWALTGYKDAAFAARALGRAEAPVIAAQGDQFAFDLHAAIRAAMRRWNIDFIPGATSLGDFDATSTTVALDPALDQAGLDPAMLAATFDRQFRRVVARRRQGATWSDYTPYEWRNVSALVRLGEPRRANALIDFYMVDRRPAAWNGWAEVVGRNPRETRFVGDMPHAWVASDFIRAGLDLIAYPRADGALVLGAGLTRSWLEGRGTSIHGLRTPWGRLDFAERIVGGRVVVNIGGTAHPPGGFVIGSPVSRKAPVVKSRTPRSDTGSGVARNRVTINLSLPIRKS